MRLFIMLILALFVSGCSRAAEPPPISASLDQVLYDQTVENYARVLTPRAFVFPRDHGPHPEYQTEWWYFTGNLTDDAGNPYGFQLTFFRRALTAQPVQRESAWATQNIYMAHLALSDVAGNTFTAHERFSRDGAGLAGATAEPFKIWLEDWVVEQRGADPTIWQLRAQEGTTSLDLTLTPQKPPAIHGAGVAVKGQGEGNATHYYSLPRLQAQGTVQVGGQPRTVTGNVWLDHEWGTWRLDPEVVGWDWFSVYLADGTDVMLGFMRTTDGQRTRVYGGSIIRPDGTTEPLAAADMQLEILDTWTSPRTNATYPSRWRLTIPREQLVLDLTPLLADQELPVSIVYWEGAIRVTGTDNGQPITGKGYAELTGYARPTGR